MATSISTETTGDYMKTHFKKHRYKYKKVDGLTYEEIIAIYEAFEQKRIDDNFHHNFATTWIKTKDGHKVGRSTDGHICILNDNDPDIKLSHGRHVTRGAGSHYNWEQFELGYDWNEQTLIDFFKVFPAVSVHERRYVA